MLNKILDNMNSNYKELFIVYVRYFYKRDDIKDVKLIDVNEEEMTLLLNENEKVRIKFTHKIEIENIHFEMIKIVKMIGNNPNENTPEYIKESMHSKNKMEKKDISDLRNHPSENNNIKLLNSEEKGEFEKRFKSHADSSGVVSDYFRKTKKMISEEELFKFLANTSKEEKGVIYVHIPYCDKICSFCNLNRKQLDNDLEEYTDFLISEFEKYGKTSYMKSKKIEVIFFGGGTPTILNENQMERIFKIIHKNYNISENCEFTFETTLHNLNFDKLKVMEKYGVNRLSVGIQSFSNKGRNILNRTFSKEETVKRLGELKENFKGMVCTDIIYNYPNQTLKEVIEDANIISSLKIDSTSFYSLMIYEGSQMSRNIKENNLKLDYQLEIDRKLHHAFLNQLLETEEYEVMEHTKIVRKDRDKYNYIRYTHQGYDILPLGIGAGGKLGNIDIFRMSKEKAFYMMCDNEKISKEERKLKKISGLFQYPVVYFSDLKEYISIEMFNEIYKLFENFEKKGYMKLSDTNLELTVEGIFWGNNIGSTVLKKCLGGYINK